LQRLTDVARARLFGKDEKTEVPAALLTDMNGGIINRFGLKKNPKLPE
jgi:hypothetical protein